MKNIQKYLLIAVAGCTVFLASCEDILTEKPAIFLSESNFYKTERDAISATNATYSNLFSGIIQYYYPTVTTDVAYQGAHNQRALAYFRNLTPNDGDAGGIWALNYQGITKANTALARIPDIPMNETLKARLLGEAKFNRAVYYFDLVRTYGGVPLLLEPVSSPEALEGIKRNTPEEVYAQIVKDLTEATAVLPESYPASDLGRATKWAAHGLLARVHLTLKDWAKAKSNVDPIIASNQFGLVADFGKLYGEPAEFTLFPDQNGKLVNENIFDIQYKQNDRGQAIQSWVGSRDLEVGGVTNIGGGWENFLPTKDFLAMFNPEDKRLPVSIVQVLDGNKLESPTTPGAGPITGKWLNRGGNPPLGNNAGQNLYYIRFADVLLMKAEAENELNKGPNEAAYQAINRVRSRAGLPALSGLNYDSFTKALRKERALELSFEGHRKYDLLRWGIYVETIKNTTDPALKVPRTNIEPHHVLMPIPQREIDVTNGSLTQNPGYN